MAIDDDYIYLASYSQTLYKIDKNTYSIVDSKFSSSSTQYQ